MRQFTNHSQARLKERFPTLTQADRRELVEQALLHGKRAMQYYDSNPKLCDYLLRRGNRQKVILHDNKIFIFTQADKLITVYELPDAYKIK